MMRTFSPLIAGAVLALGIVGAAQADSYDDGEAAYWAGDYVTAWRLLTPLAEQGDARSEHLLGQAYLAGNGVPKDYSAAAAWLRRAAVQGLSAAELDLGAMYANGDGVPQDYAEALRWWRLAKD
jgi:TPR repeat protein